MRPTAPIEAPQGALRSHTAPDPDPHAAPEDDVGPIVAGQAAREVVQNDALREDRGPRGRIDAEREASYWREHHAQRPYVQAGDSFADYGPAYAYGAQARGRYAGGRFEDAQAALENEWPGHRDGSTLSWARAKDAVRDAWDRLTGPNNPS